MRKRQDAAALEDRDKPYVCDSECLLGGGGGHPGWGGARRDEWGPMGLNGTQWDQWGSMRSMGTMGFSGAEWNPMGTMGAMGSMAPNGIQ